MNLRSWTLSQDDWTFSEDAPPDAIFLAEGLRTTALSRYGDRPDADWRQGHVFTDAWHVRWRRLGHQVRVVVAGAPPALVPEGAPGHTLDLSTANTAPYQYILWGRRNAGESFWLELRIPHFMEPPHDHPAEHGDEVAGTAVRRLLRSVRYLDPDTGATVFERFTGLTYAASNEDDTTFELID